MIIVIRDNTLAYADRIRLFAPSWHGLQVLLNVTENTAEATDTTPSTLHVVDATLRDFNFR